MGPRQRGRTSSGGGFFLLSPRSPAGAFRGGAPLPGLRRRRSGRRRSSSSTSGDARQRPQRGRAGADSVGPARARRGPERGGELLFRQEGLPLPPPFLEGKGTEPAPYPARPDPAGHVLAHVFKIVSDPYLGKKGVMRVHQGTLRPGMPLYVGHGRKPFKVAHLFMLQGKEHVEIEQALPGDLCAIAKVDELHYDAVLHDDQWAAIEALVVDRRRALVVQRTGWGKSAVYFVATALLRGMGAVAAGRAGTALLLLTAVLGEPPAKNARDSVTQKIPPPLKEEEDEDDFCVAEGEEEAAAIGTRRAAWEVSPSFFNVTPRRSAVAARFFVAAGLCGARGRANAATRGPMRGRAAATGRIAVFD